MASRRGRQAPRRRTLPPPYDARSTFSALFGGAALTMLRLMPGPGPPPLSPPPILLQPGAGKQEQHKQCAATTVEYERWRDKRDEVTNFALASVFHPLRWISSGGLAGKKTVHIDEVRRAFCAASLDHVMRPVVEKHWPSFSPEGGGGAARALTGNTGTDLREVLAAVQLLRDGSSDRALDANIGGTHVQWWDGLLRACAVDGEHMYKHAHQHAHTVSS